MLAQELWAVKMSMVMFWMCKYYFKNDQVAVYLRGKKIRQANH